MQNQVTCDSATTYTSLTKPKLFATGTDNNPSPLPGHAELHPADLGGNGRRRHAGRPTGASGSQQSTTPPTALDQRDGLQVRRLGDEQPDRHRVGRANWADVGVLSVHRADRAGHRADDQQLDYPQGQWGQPAGAPGVFTVGTNGASNIAGFAYSFDGGAGSEPVPTTADCCYNNDGGLGTSVDSNGDGRGSTSGELALVQGTTAQIQIPNAMPSGPHTLFVVSFDMAHNISGESAYTFYVPPNFQGTSQPMTYHQRQLAGGRRDRSERVAGGHSGQLLRDRLARRQRADLQRHRARPDLHGHHQRP